MLPSFTSLKTFWQPGEREKTLAQQDELVSEKVLTSLASTACQIKK